VVEADEIIGLMEKLARQEILFREKSLSSKELSVRTKAIALAALKFFFLRVTPKQAVHFNPEKSISFVGDTGPYLLYTYARIKSILRKINGGSLTSLTSLIDYSVLKEKN